MSHRSSSFWLGLATHWIKIVTAAGTFAVAIPGLRMIDSVMISGSDDWSVHGPVLMSGLAYVACAVLVLATGLALGDLLRLVLRWEDQLRRQEQVIVAERPQALMPPLPNSRALLESLGIGTAQPARATISNAFQRNA